jgi:hypothetical protein
MKKCLVAVLLMVAGPVFGAGEYTYPYVRDIIAPQSGGTLGTSITLPATGFLQFSGRAKLQSGANGQFTISKADGTITTLSSGILLSGGPSLVYDAVNGWRSMNNDQTANSGFGGSGFAAVTNNTFYGFATGTIAGMNVTSGTAIDLRTNSTVAVSIDSAQVVTVSQAKLAVGTCKIYSGSGSPEGALTAGICSMWLRTDGGASTTLYIKESGAGNTGWVAK